MTGSKQKKQNKAQAKQVKSAVKQQINALERRGQGRGPVDDHTLRIASRIRKLGKLHGNEVINYALCLHDPEMYKARFPDPYPRRSALYQSVQEFDIPISFGFSDSNLDGRFAVALRPILGDIRDFKKYRAYVPKSDAAGWETGVFTPDDFVPSSPAADPRQDPEVARLIGQVPACAAYYTYATSDSPGTLDADRWDFLLAERVANWFKSFDNTGIEFSRLYNAASQSRIKFPATAQPMEYRISFSSAFDSAGNANPYGAAGTPANTTVVETGDITLNDVTGWVGSPGSSAQLAQNSGTQDSNFRQLSTKVLSVSVGVAGGSILIGNTTGNMWNSQAGVIGQFASPTVKRIRLTIAGFPTISSDSGTFGLMKNLRPVGTSLLVKWVGPLIENAGKISAALAPVGTFGDDIFRPTNQIFNPFFYEAYQRLNNSNDGASVLHTARLDRGAYVSYMPQSVQHTEFKSYDESNSTDWPLLCVAGQYFKASSPLSGGEGIFFRGRLTTVYEYTTNSSIPEVESLGRAIPQAVPTAYNVLHDLDIPCVMENDIHSVYTAILSGIQKFLGDVATTVGGTAGSLVGSFRDKSGTLPALTMGPTGMVLSLKNS